VGEPVGLDFRQQKIVIHALKPMVASVAFLSDFFVDLTLRGKQLAVDLDGWTLFFGLL